jgi:all-trans-8'-apo-beta-carotenal 15,15'-oxygenase
MVMPRSVLARDGVPDLDLQMATGSWPDDVAGEVFLSTSDLATAPKHAFFGDGVIARLSLRPGTHGASPGSWAWRARIIDTPSRRLRGKRPEVFAASPIGAQSPFGSSNAANTAPLPWGDRLFATWDAGRPVEIDPLTLEFVAEVGHRDGWQPAIDAPVLPLIGSTAHPIIDPDRNCMWTVSLNPILQQVQLIRYDGDGSMVSRWPVADAPIPQSMHTITQTRDWLILADCAFKADPNELFGLGERTVTNNPDEPVYLIRKADVDAAPSGEPVRSVAFRIGPEVMHYYAAYDDTEGITVLFEHTRNSELAIYLREGDVDATGAPVDPRLHGMYNHPMHPGEVTVLRFDPETGAVMERARLDEPDRYYAQQLSAIDWSTEGISRPTVHHLLFSGFQPEAIVGRAIDLYRDRLAPWPSDPVPPVLASLDRESLKPIADHAFAADDYPTSPVFVPRGSNAGGTRYAGADPGGHDGYLVVPVLHDDGFRVELFDAADVGAGPLATLRAPAHQTVPFLLHSAWMPRAVAAPRDVERLRFADELDDDRLALLPDDLAATAREVAAELAAG